MTSLPPFCISARTAPHRTATTTFALSRNKQVPDTLPRHRPYSTHLFVNAKPSYINKRFPANMCVTPTKSSRLPGTALTQPAATLAAAGGTAGTSKCGPLRRKSLARARAWDAQSSCPGPLLSRTDQLAFSQPALCCASWTDFLRAKVCCLAVPQTVEAHLVHLAGLRACWLQAG